MGLIPVDGGGGGGARDQLAHACHFCAEPSAGPCAWCRLPICGDSECSAVMEEPGIRPVVLCRTCAASRPAAARRPWLPLVLVLAGIAVSASAALLLQPTLLAGTAYVVGAALILSAAAGLWSRIQWRRRLARARSDAAMMDDRP